MHSMNLFRSSSSLPRSKVSCQSFSGGFERLSFIVGPLPLNHQHVRLPEGALKASKLSSERLRISSLFRVRDA